MNSRQPQIRLNLSESDIKQLGLTKLNLPLPKALYKKLKGLVISREIAFSKAGITDTRTKAIGALKPMATSEMNFTLVGICKVILRHQDQIRSILPKNKKYYRMQDQWEQIIQFSKNLINQHSHAIKNH